MSTDDSELNIAEAAYWRVAKPNLKIEVLASHLKVSRNTFSNRLKEAEQKGWLTNDWIIKALPEGLWSSLAGKKDSELENKINELFGTYHLGKLTVVPSWPPKGFSSSPEGSSPSPDEETNMKMVAHAAAKVFRDRLDKMQVIGLSYGRTLRVMVDALEHFATELRSRVEQSKEKRTIVTIFGSLSFHFEDDRHSEWLENSASHLTNRLARILGTGMCKRRFLETPVYVPPDFLDLFKESTDKTDFGNIGEKQALKIAKAFVESIPTYHDVFAKRKEREIEKLDTVITSVGDLKTGFGSLPAGKAAPFLRDDEMEKLTDEAVGDIAGCYIDENGMTGKPGSTIAKANERVFGLKIEDLENIYQHAKENDKPGVIVIASSKAKARVILALLSRPRKVISELIISGDLAEEFLKETTKKNVVKRKARE